MWEWICTMNFRNVENSPTPVFLWKLLVFTVSGSLCKGIWEESAALRWCNEGGHTQEHTDRPEGHPRRVVMRRRLSCTDREGYEECGNIYFQDYLDLANKEGEGNKCTDTKHDKLILTKTITRNKLSHTTWWAIRKWQANSDYAADKAVNMGVQDVIPE